MRVLFIPPISVALGVIFTLGVTLLLLSADVVPTDVVLPEIRPGDTGNLPLVGGTDDDWDSVPLDPPAGATDATIDLLHPPTSGESSQLLPRANDASDAHLADDGTELHDAWWATGMAAPHVMVTNTWGTEPSLGVPVPDVVGLPQAEAEDAIVAAGLAVGAVDFASSDTVPVGDVVTQTPVAGTELPLSSPVDLVVSLGPAPTGGVAIVGTLETWAVTHSGSPIVPSSTFAPGDRVGVLVGVVDGESLPLVDAVVTVEFIASVGGGIEHTASGTTAADGMVMVRWSSRTNTSAGPYTARVASVERLGSTFDPSAGTTEVFFTIQ